MNDKVTLRDVANAAGVSKATVSNVFSRPERVRPELRARIAAVAGELGYSGPDPKGRLLSSGKVNAIGVVPPAEDSFAWAFSDPYMCEFLGGVAEVCETEGSGLSIIAASNRNGESGIRRAVVDGFILSTAAQAEAIEPAMRRKLPFVVMDADGGPDISSVRIDDRGGAGDIARHLIKLGHRKIAILSISRRSISPVVHRPGSAHRDLIAAFPSDIERIEGIAAALSEAGLSINDMPIVEACCTSEEERIFGVSGASVLLDHAQGATAVIALSGLLALAVLKEARKRGISVPGQMSVAGFDDGPEIARADPPLTTVAQPIAEKGRMAARLLFERQLARQVILPVELKVRASTALPPETA
jgi:DNA-binding LacI/PurR family transcriptional regulator